MAEIEAAINEEREARQGLGIKEAFFGKGNFIRFLLAFVIFLLQQWSGQNSVGYYAPQIFTSVRVYRKFGPLCDPQSVGCRLGIPEQPTPYWPRGSMVSSK